MFTFNLKITFITTTRSSVGFVFVFRSKDEGGVNDDLPSVDSLSDVLATKESLFFCNDKNYSFCNKIITQLNCFT